MAPAYCASREDPGTAMALTAVKDAAATVPPHTAPPTQLGQHHRKRKNQSADFLAGPDRLRPISFEDRVRGQPLGWVAPNCRDWGPATLLAVLSSRAPAIPLALALTPLGGFNKCPLLEEHRPHCTAVVGAQVRPPAAVNKSPPALPVARNRRYCTGSGRETLPPAWRPRPSGGHPLRLPASQRSSHCKFPLSCASLCRADGRLHGVCIATLLRPQHLLLLRPAAEQVRFLKGSGWGMRPRVCPPPVQAIVRTAGLAIGKLLGTSTPMPLL